jgi:hypothetical protein
LHDRRETIGDMLDSMTNGLSGQALPPDDSEERWDHARVPRVAGGGALIGAVHGIDQHLRWFVPLTKLRRRQ